MATCSDVPLVVREPLPHSTFLCTKMFFHHMFLFSLLLFFLAFLDISCHFEYFPDSGQFSPQKMLCSPPAVGEARCDTQFHKPIVTTFVCLVLNAHVNGVWVCATYSSCNDGCGWEAQINIKRCLDDTYRYQLVAPNACPVGYCVGDFTDCLT